MFSSLISGGQSDDYHWFHRTLIITILLVVLYHLYLMKTDTVDQKIFMHIVLLECIAIIYEYFG